MLMFIGARVWDAINDPVMGRLCDTIKLSKWGRYRPWFLWAQVMQAEAAGIAPSVLMNPILLKPTNDVGSQVIVRGEVLGNMSAREYFSYKKKLIPTICDAFSELEKQADIIVIEGAGSPAEINLKEDDIVNMGLAEIFDAPVLLVGDIV